MQSLFPSAPNASSEDKSLWLFAIKSVMAIPLLENKILGDELRNWYSGEIESGKVVATKIDNDNFNKKIYGKTLLSFLIIL